jgi:hypothetical protein
MHTPDDDVSDSSWKRSLWLWSAWLTSLRIQFAICCLPTPHTHPFIEQNLWFFRKWCLSTFRGPCVLAMFSQEACKLKTATESASWWKRRSTYKNSSVNDIYTHSVKPKHRALCCDCTEHERYKRCNQVMINGPMRSSFIICCFNVGLISFDWLSCMWAIEALL